MAKKKRAARSSSSSGIMRLPEDVLVDILSRLPMETLHKKLIFVCKSWATIIQGNPILVKRHALDGEPAGLFLQEKSNSRITRFLELKEGKFELRNYKFKFSQGQIMGSSGGVALFYNEKDGGTFHVANPYTGYFKKLPRAGRDPLYRIFDRGINISVIPDNGNGIVKVVYAGLDRKGKCYYWGVLTVGVDISWRKIATTLQQPNDHHLYYQKLISIGGVIYSKFRWKNPNRDSCIHAIDLRDETTRFFQVPKELGDGESWLMEMGENLCCIVQDLTVHNVWILKDSNQNIWVQLYRIDVHFTENIGNNCHLEPIGWLDNNQSLVFSVRKGTSRAPPSMIAAYNVTIGKKITYNRVQPYLYKVWLHKNTILFF